jgi:FKBP-type peptidyl-prolyl cis-trans isomerase FkpA
VPGPSDPDAPQEFTTTDSGLKYRILRKGSGPQPLPTDEVQVHFKGWLDDGTQFDSTYERGSPVGSVLGEVPIPGLVEGIQYVNEGGMIELEIPHELGYGHEGVPQRIPPHATLHFTVELLEVHREGAGISP